MYQAARRRLQRAYAVADERPLFVISFAKPYFTEALRNFTLLGALGLLPEPSRGRRRPPNLNILPLLGALVHGSCCGVCLLFLDGVPVPLTAGLYVVLLTILTGPMIWSWVPRACATVGSALLGRPTQKFLNKAPDPFPKPGDLVFLILILGPKWMALRFFLVQETQTLLLQAIFVGALSRIAALMTMVLNDPQRRPPKIILQAKDPDRGMGIILAMTSALGLTLLGWQMGLVALGLAWIVAAVFSKAFQKFQGGVSLGVLGLSSEAVEIGLFFLLSNFLTQN